MQFARTKPSPLNLANDPIDVGAVIVRDDQGRVLMAERLKRQKSGGFWEIPGGKLEGAETPAQAALRELTEETGLVADAASLRPFSVHLHMFETRTIRVHLFLADRWEGSASGREGQRIEWVDPANPTVAPILPSNIRALTLMALPMLVTRVALSGAVAPAGAASLIDEPGLPPVQRAGLARRLRASAGFGGLWLAGGPSEAATARADVQIGHVGAAPPMSTPARQCLWGVPCESGADIARAVAEGADLVLLRVRTTPDGALDWGGFAQAAAAASIPVWADGPLSADHLDLAVAAGAAGLCTGHAALR